MTVGELLVRIIEALNQGELRTDSEVQLETCCDINELSRVNTDNPGDLYLVGKW